MNELLFDISQVIAELRQRVESLENKEAPAHQIGTWTPTLIGAGTPGSFTYDASNTGGAYERIGNRVYFHGRLRITAIATAPTGDLRIGGLPITSANEGFIVTGGAALSIWQGITLTAGYSQLMLRITANVAYLNVTQAGSGVAQGNIQGSALALIGGSANFDFQGQYRVA